MWQQGEKELPADTLAVAVDPESPSRLYAGTFSGNVFESTDNGATWNALTAIPDSITALAFDPSIPSTAYTSSIFSGVYKTTNGGASWQEASGGLPGSPITALAIDPANPSTLYAGAGVYFLGGGNTYTIEGGGVFKTEDGGATWSAVITGLPDKAAIEALAIDPTAPSTLYAGASWSNTSDGDGGVFKTTTGGATWSAVNTGLPDPVAVQALAIDPSNASVLYAATGDFREATVGSDGVFKSTDAGGHWSGARAGLSDSSPYSDRIPVLALAINPKMPSTLYAGLAGGMGVFRSTDRSLSMKMRQSASEFSVAPAATNV